MRAYRVGLLSSVSASENLDAEIGKILGHLVAGGPQALAKIKDLIRRVSSGSVDDSMIDDTAKRIAEIRVSPEGKRESPRSSRSASLRGFRKVLACSARS
jgi:methylglutaconyl-CoA hydratase